jgi:alpha-glucuronidase
LVDERRYREALAQLEYQAGHAVVWRDSVVSWFARESRIPDAKGRAGNYPGRVEAESMKLEGYMPTVATPWETASSGQAVSCPVAQCAASFSFNGAPGWYAIRVQYFDQDNGVSHFRLLVGGQTVDEWDADDHLPSRKLDGAASSRRTVGAVALRPGDAIRIEGTPGGGERAAIDYVEIAARGK